MQQTREIYNSNGEVIEVETWEIPDEVINAQMTQARIEAYRDEADPLYFKAQRGEIEQQVWLDKIEEIKQRYPKAIENNPEL